MHTWTFAVPQDASPSLKSLYLAGASLRTAMKAKLDSVTLSAHTHIHACMNLPLTPCIVKLIVPGPLYQRVNDNKMTGKKF